ncbi:MAG: protein-L-isoaspartate O-methyltransferase family protein [Burkholderiales bacterium]
MATALNIEQARFNMVEQQIRTWDVLDQNILDLLYIVPREKFVPLAYQALAFSDLEIPLGAAPGERMWAPRMEARILQELALGKSENVLEVGTGSGYLCALMARRAGRIYSVEINPVLAKLGETNLSQAGIDNATVEIGDGARGWVKHAPYDVVVMTGSVPTVPEDLLAQVKPGGRLFAIVGDEPVMRACILTKSSSGSISQTELFETCLTPLVNAQQPTRFRF